MNVLWLSYDPESPARGYWCEGWLEETLAEFDHYTDPTDLPEGEGAVIVLCVPPEYPTYYVNALSTTIATLPWSVVVIASDEQGRFPIEELVIPDTCKLWVMTPHFEKHTYPAGTQFMGEMSPPEARERIGECEFYRERPYRWSFSGQITHQRRYEMVESLQDTAGGRLIKTAGFKQGLAQTDYYALLNESITVPAPSGPVTPDSFRAFEALDAGCVPILDGACPKRQPCEVYWRAVLGDHHPLRIVKHWSEAIPLIENNSDVWPTENIRVSSWWQMYKRDLRYRLLSGVPGFDFGNYTILMPTSVIPSHPSMEKIEAVHASVRWHHPHADIIIMCDGVRDEQLHRTDDYEAYLLELTDACAHRRGWENTYPLVFESHQHQANMTRWALDHVHTPLIMYAEHDIQMVTDMPIDWDSITALALSRKVDVVKFSFESMGIHPEHEHMALDPEIVMLEDCPVRRSTQWSQRPHVAHADYYRWMLEEYFPPTCRTMIEDRMHSVAQEFPESNVLASYIPLEGSAVRCFHIDGREEDIKYEMKYD